MTPYRPIYDNNLPLTLLQQHYAQIPALLATITHAVLVDRGAEIEKVPITCRDQRGVPDEETYKFTIRDKTTRQHIELYMVNAAGRIVDVPTINWYDGDWLPGDIVALTFGYEQPFAWEERR